MMYDFISGPLVWIGLLGFALGSLYRVAMMLKKASGEKTVIPTFSAKHGARSVAHWVIPFANRTTRAHPVFTAVSFAFHLCLLATPLLVMGHAVLWQQSWGLSWWSLPPLIADLMTLVVILGGLFFMLRRLTAPEVRNVTDWRDIALVLLVIAPFLTGFIAHQGWLHHRVMMQVHIVTGVAWLLAVPFTRLSHMLWFLFSRAYMGSEFGAVRNARDW
jgi:nitrate reductase gamma subunit